MKNVNENKSNKVKLIQHYIKDLSFENPQDISQYNSQLNNNEISTNMNVIYEPYNDNYFSLVIKISIDCTSKENNKLCTQYSTGSGPLDILAISKDKKEFLVIELKKGRASDVVMGQIQRYMGHIKNNLAGDKDVKGLIIALEDDKNLRDALSVAPNIKFMKYEVSFKLVG